ncbi:unnamed protein product, partial [Prorocentrum cordatum]
KADGTDLGLAVSQECEALLIESVRSGGAVEAWNRSCSGGPCPDRVVGHGDRIVGVNGVTQNPERMLEDRCEAKQLLRLTIRRGLASVAVIGSRKRPYVHACGRLRVRSHRRPHHASARRDRWRLAWPPHDDGRHAARRGARAQPTIDGGTLGGLRAPGQLGDRGRRMRPREPRASVGPPARPQFLLCADVEPGDLGRAANHAQR